VLVERINLSEPLKIFHLALISRSSLPAVYVSSPVASLASADRRELYQQWRLALSVFSGRSLDQPFVSKPLASRPGVKTIKAIKGMTLHVPFVEAEGELINVAAEMLFAGVMIDPDEGLIWLYHASAMFMVARADMEMAAAAQKTPRRSFSDDFKQKALGRVRAGETVASVARELGIVPNLLYLWKSNFSSGAIEPELALERLSSPVSESKDLARENELLRAEIEYLRKRESILKRK